MPDRCKMQISPPPPPPCTIDLLTLYGYASHKFPVIDGTFLLKSSKLQEIYGMHAHIRWGGGEANEWTGRFNMVHRSYKRTSAGKHGNSVPNRSCFD